MRNRYKVIAVGLALVVAISASVVIAVTTMWLASAGQEPIHWLVTGYDNPYSLESAASLADAIIEGSVETVAPSRWTTDDGTRQGMSSRELKDAGYTIVTPFLITPSRVWKGDLETGPVTVYQQGGAVEGDVVEVDEEALMPIRDGRSGIYFLFTADDYLRSLAGTWEVRFALTEETEGIPKDLYTRTEAELEEAREYLADHTGGAE